MTRPRIDMTVNLGHLLTVAVLAVGIFGAYAGVKTDQRVLEVRQDNLENRFEDSTKILEEVRRDIKQLLQRK